MVRRSTVDRSPQSAMHSAGYEAGTGDLARESEGTQHRVTQGWRGAGGRWLVWVFRGVLWLVLLVIGYRGVMAIVLNETPAGSRPGASAPAATSFPIARASAFVLAFGQVYLNVSPAASAQRATELAAFLPPGADPQLGWDGKGSLALQSEQVAATHVQGPHRALVTLLALVNGRLMELGVPVYAAHGGMVVSGEPAWLSAPPQVTPPASGAPATDSALQATLITELPAFFQAYASGNRVTLARFLAPGTMVTGLNGEVAFGSLSAVTVPPGGTTRHVIATVQWRIPGQDAAAGRPAVTGAPPGGLEMTYALTIVKQNGTWYIENINSSTEAVGPP